jgi:hypothetical protein
MLTLATAVATAMGIIGGPASWLLERPFADFR